VRTMADLVDRVPSSEDGRGVVLVATARAKELLARYDRASASMLRDSLAKLSPEDQQVLESAVPALRRLLSVLDE